MKNTAKLNELLQSNDHQESITTEMKLNFYECVMHLFKETDVLKVIESLDPENPVYDTITKLWVQYYSHIKDLQEFEGKVKLTANTQS